MLERRKQAEQTLLGWGQPDPQSEIQATLFQCYTERPSLIYSFIHSFRLEWIASLFIQHKRHQDMETMLPDQIRSLLGWDLEASLTLNLQFFPLLPTTTSLGSHSALHYDNYAEPILPLSKWKWASIISYPVKRHFRLTLHRSKDNNCA